MTIVVPWLSASSSAPYKPKPAIGWIVRYRLPETTRAYAREKLIESVEFRHSARTHAQYYRDLFQGAGADS